MPQLNKGDLTMQALHIPGTSVDQSQAMQMRFNELIAGVRGDIAVKAFSDDFE